MGYIYIRSDTSNHLDNVCKLGQTSNIPDRDFQYATGEYIRGHFIKVIEILDEQYDHIYIGKILQCYFKIFHMKKSGGGEFYKNDIIDLIVPFLDKTIITFKVLNENEINDLIRTYRIDKIKHILVKIKINKFSKEEIFRNTLQNNYLKDIITELNINKKVFIKAPTGFGKSHIYYKTIKEMKFNRVLFLTPRLNLNIQITGDKYSSYIKDDNYKIIHYSHYESNEKERIIKKYSSKNNKIIMTSCYQSGKKLLELIKHYNMLFDVIIFDEAHFITNWKDNENIKDFLDSFTISIYKIFGSATPTEDIELNSKLYGNIVEKVKVYELINNEILCDIETIVKKLDNKKKEYHNLRDLIVNTMITYNKKKGIIYTNNCKNAENLHILMKTQDKIKSYIYISKEIIDIDTINEKNIIEFENNEKPCIIICVGMISFGYNNSYIDLISLADPRQSAIDIRQIIGRSLRWNKLTYPNKILHLLIPLYKDEFDNYPKNDILKNYLDYIIDECGKYIIIKNKFECKINNGTIINEGKNYGGENIPIEILQDYCTNRYSMYSDFIKFLNNNNIYDQKCF
jgi:superfamily II DNA or RNA helicase